MNRIISTPQVSSVFASQARQVLAKRNGSTSGGHDDHLGSIINMKQFAAYAAIGIAALGVFIFATDKHGHRCETAYPYLAIRSKPFPWGDGNTSLFEQGTKKGGHH